jgi:hypothetical protein
MAGPRLPTASSIATRLAPKSRSTRYEGAFTKTNAVARDYGISQAYAAPNGLSGLEIRTNQRPNDAGIWIGLACAAHSPAVRVSHNAVSRDLEDSDPQDREEVGSCTHERTRTENKRPPQPAQLAFSRCASLVGHSWKIPLCVSR